MNDEIPIGKLVPNNYNPRKRFDSAKMRELEGSIKNQGIVQAITVRPLDNGKFEVVAGMRRYTAAKNVGLNKIPAMIRRLSDEEAKLLSITENLERSDLTPIEEARAFAKYLNWNEQKAFEGIHQNDGFQVELVQLANHLPITDKTVRNRLSLLHIPESLQIRVEQETLPIKWAEVLVRLKDLWEIRIAGMNEEEIKEKISEIKVGIHQIMEEIATTIKKTKTGFTPSLSELRKRVSQYIEAEQMNLDQREKLIIKIKRELDEALEKVQVFYEKIETFPSDWEALTTDEKLEWIKLHIESQIKKLTDEKLEEISKKREILSIKHDRYLMNLSYVKDAALDSCPHCGAAIKTDFIERRINELQDEIEVLSEEENNAGGELKEWRSKKSNFEKIKREYNAKLNSFNASLKEVLDE